MAQVPQGVGYQGVATDANGIELVNQAISIRASVLSGSATGTIEWEETHATSTDTFGLFTLTIGQGTNTTNGLQTSFADISWGTNTYFLKIEMDVTGGSNYSNMGTNQMMSVPYALFAESANINYDSISFFLSGDSTFINSIGGGGCDIKFPDGLVGDIVNIDLLQGNYIVPNGKTLYIVTIYSYSTNSNPTLEDDGIGMIHGPVNYPGGSTIFNPFIFESGSNLTGLATFYGFLINNSDIIPISHLLCDGSIIGVVDYVVPNGKSLYITQSYGGLNINNNQFGDNLNMHSTGGGAQSNSLGQVIKVNSGEIVNWSSNYASFNGYLVDENYFANCGGGGGSSTTSGGINNNFIDSIVKENISFSVGMFNPGLTTSDTIVLDYEDGRSLVLDGHFYAGSGQSQISITVLDDGFNEIPSHKYKSSGYSNSSNNIGMAINELNHTITSSTSFYSGYPQSSSYFSLTTNFAQLNTTKIYIFISIDTQGGSSIGSADVDIQY